MSPDVDDLIVALTVRNNALAILLLDLFDLPVSPGQLGLLFLRNNHVGNSNGDSGLGCFGEAELLQSIESFDRTLLSGNLITAPDNVAKLLLTRRLVEEPELLRPNFIENDPASCGLDHARLGIAVDCLFTEIGILEPNAIVGF